MVLKLLGGLISHIRAENKLQTLYLLWIQKSSGSELEYYVRDCIKLELPFRALVVDKMVIVHSSISVNMFLSTESGIQS